MISSPSQVCILLGIQDEADYFGLQFPLSKGDLIWLNMRNRLARQIPGNPPFNLFFKVKYFVPPYNLVLEETKLVLVFFQVNGSLFKFAHVI